MAVSTRQSKSGLLLLLAIFVIGLALFIVGIKDAEVVPAAFGGIFMGYGWGVFLGSIDVSKKPQAVGAEA